jgi:ubiquinol-cytochrome c reductase iron-sulfur subunit
MSPGPGRFPLATVAAAFAFAASALASIALVVVYLEGGNPQLEGTFLAITAGGVGVGIVIWARHEMGEPEDEEPRGRLESTEEEIAAFRADFEAGEDTLRRRKILLVLLGGAFAAMGAALLLPIRSLGPRPGRGLKQTAFGDGRRLVTATGDPVAADEIPVDGVLTVWPEGNAGAPDSPTLLIRLRSTHRFQPREGREDWTADNLVAYSKLCTHTGCPVGLYQSQSALLLCPCHQSTFDVLDGAEPVFGPAARPLPQLPIDIDDEGFVIARGDFSDPVGPGFWDRGR